MSLVCPSYDKLEPGCPPYRERLEIVRKIASTGKRVLIRIQPYMTEVFKEVMSSLEDFAEAGVYGVIVEGMKFTQKRPGLEKLGGDYVYPQERLKKDFLALKDKAHSLGMKFFSGENRLRSTGDSLTCCGVGDLFEVNTYNLNHILNGDKTQPSKAQSTPGTGYCFKSLYQKTSLDKTCRTSSFEQMMKYHYNRNPKKIREVFGKK